MLTVAEILRSRKPIKVWVKFWEHDGDFVPLSRAAFKRAVDGMDESIFAIETEQFILVG